CLCSSHTHPAPLAFPTRRSSDLHCCREVPWSNCCYKPDWLMADNNALRFRICRYGTSINPFCLFRIPVNITCCVINFAQRLMEWLSIFYCHCFCDRCLIFLYFLCPFRQ